MNHKFYLFGLQRTGTCFIGDMLCKNFGLEYANREGSWKHSLIPNTDYEYPVIKTIKAPYTWLESVTCRDPADVAETNPVVTEKGDHMIGAFNVPKLMEMYRDHYIAWKNTGVLIRYEDVLYPTQSEELLSTLGFSRTLPDWYVTPPGSLFMSEGFTNKRLPYYEKQLPTRPEVTESHIGIVNSILDPINFFKETSYIRY